MSIPTPAMLYTQGYGSRPENVEVPFYSTVAPSSSNVNFPLGKRWITSAGEYVLTSFSSSNGILTANWTLLGANGTQIASASGTDPMIAGVVTVSDVQTQTDSVIIFSPITLGGTAGDWSLSNIQAGSFQINSTSNTDTTNFYYLIINP